MSVPNYVAIIYVIINGERKRFVRIGCGRPKLLSWINQAYNHIPKMPGYQYIESSYVKKNIEKKVFYDYDYPVFKEEEQSQEVSVG